MRLIPGKTKVKIELFRGITLGDIIVGVITLGLTALVLLSTLPGRVYITVGVLAVGILLVFRIDSQPNYRLILNLLKYLSFPKRYWRTFTDKHLISSATELNKGDHWKDFFSEKYDPDEADSIHDTIEKMIDEKKRRKDEDKLLASSDVSDEEKNAIWQERKEREDAAVKKKADSKEDSLGSGRDIEDVIPFTGIGDGFIEYNGKYYGTIIEIDPVEFRFFSQFRRNASIENCLGKILRSLKMDYSANIIKIDRPIIYDKYLDKEYEKLDELRASYEKGLLTEDELKSRVEIQFDRINAMRDICFENKVVQPFYYFAIYNIDKRQLQIDTDSAVSALTQGELTVRRLVSDKELAVFLKYTNCLDFDERDIDRINPKDYVKWAMPESLAFNTRRADINKIVTHQMRVVNYPSDVGDAWLAGVMSVPSTKVVVKITPMERTKSIRTIDRSLQELRGRLMTTGVDSKRLELESHIETLSRLLVTLQQDNESLLTVNIYISMYDAIKTSEWGRKDAVKNTSLAVIADMKKTVRRVWQETGMRLNSMDYSQLEAFIGSQVSGYDPMLNDGRPMPANTVAAMYPWIYSRVSDEGGIRLGTQDGVPVFIDFFRRDQERVNSNMVIIGKSGSGKSYGTKALLTNMASENAKIFILDPENEYTELAHTLHGKIINVGNAKFGRLNPFHIITTLEDDEAGGDDTGTGFSAHLQFLEEFFRQILPDVDKEALEYLNSMVERLYTNFGITMETDLSTLTPADYPIFDDLYDIVLEDFQRTRNEYLRSMLQTLLNYVSKFATGGRNANIWNGPSTVTTDENFSVFNFQSLLANRNSTIANAQMLLVLKYIDNEIIKNRDYNRKYGLNRKIVVVIDEAHIFIDTKFPIALDFMFQLAKRIRKYNGMQIVITQNIKDFVGSEEIARKSTAIINACQYSFIFGLAPNDMDDLCKLYEKAGGINEIEQDQIVTAPRGMAFTVMSPTSRSSFMIEVPQEMVDMFEQPDYQSHYFDGDDGAQVWEDFVADSRAEHEANASDRISGYVYEKPAQSAGYEGFTFSEITAEEADRLYGGNDGDTREEPSYRSARRQQPEEDDDEGFTFEEISSEPEPEPAPAAPQPQPVQPVIDVASLIATIREEVRREMSVQLAQQAAEAARNAAPIRAAREEPTEEDLLLEDELPEEIAEPEKPVAAPAMGGRNIPRAPQPVPEEPEEEEDEDFTPKFDIMSLLDEQLDSYSEMTLAERMDEIDVKTMEISLDELASHIRDLRKKRGA
ncbi:AAA-like domain-containing protein [Ruminococcaceae bacterium FB2012]|nr:AAA-like domain-containing protein [Ruminococcaceae bacterium FB2012]